MARVHQAGHLCIDNMNATARKKTRNTLDSFHSRSLRPLSQKELDKVCANAVLNIGVLP